MSPWLAARSVGYEVEAIVPGFRKVKHRSDLVLTHLWTKLPPELSTAEVSCAGTGVQQTGYQRQTTDPARSAGRRENRHQDGEPLEFGVKYLIDPSAISSHPEQPDQQGAVVRGAKSPIL